ncbi:hypothetical protein B0H14DRAFT_2583235 [Mycena olivaceomarginata]|nr:hypothetical protein B0H14DRAFT_2583235 [Mycena olivaceomarginata]
MTQDTLPFNPPVARRMHASEAIISADKKLPWVLKLAKNKDIEIRNTDCALRTVQHAHNPITHPNAASDNKLFITLSDAPHRRAIPGEQDQEDHVKTLPVVHLRPDVHFRQQQHVETHA